MAAVLIWTTQPYISVKRLFLFPTVVLLTFIGSLRADDAFDDLFHMTQAAAKSSFGIKKFKMLQAAADDFDAAMHSKPPIHAKIEYAVADGGTEVYKGVGYRLTVVNQISHVGRGPKAAITGYMCGPVLDLGPELGGGTDSINFSRVSFYPNVALKRRLK